MRAHKLSGFTLVELIIVIILLAILSVYAASRYIGLGSFSALQFKTQLSRSHVKFSLMGCSRVSLFLTIVLLYRFLKLFWI
ncbi:prepilin-type N-terminal cleavage/methylation domain-containing protein [Vibrio taketomensis]|uniref:prepilin-type N-terminal cleavage/methylation domain-containing protein n=1 Tax=Vibrio taketomensis TaxID=2572923 RepID=UPI001E3C1DA2|nr:prepilin-type N-terminal cleavage/methylation domain-containing protein [Vibrio taketomensis]